LVSSDQPRGLTEIAFLCRALVRYSTMEMQHTNTEIMKRITSIVLVTAFAVSCSTPDNNSAASDKDNTNSRKEVITEMTAAPIAGIREIETTTSTAAQVAQAQAAAENEPASAGTGGSTAASDPAVTTEEEGKKRKKLNNTAKGIIIGLGAGAITGAAIDKNNRGKGAVIGAAVGAAAGGATGAVIDHRQKKK
jgi:hypothetical protein